MVEAPAATGSSRLPGTPDRPTRHSGRHIHNQSEEHTAPSAVLATQHPAGRSADEFRLRLPEGFRHTRKLLAEGVIEHNRVRVGAAVGLLIHDIGSHESLLSAL